MPDISAGWVQTLAKMRAAGVSKFMFKVTAPTADDAYYCPGDVVDGKINSKPITQMDGYGRPKTCGHAVDIVLPTYQASAVEIKLLDDLILNQPLALKLNFTDTLNLESTLLGLTWKLICEGDMTSFRRIEYGFKGNLTLSELDALTNTSDTADGTADAGDILYTLLQIPKKANEVPGGISKIEFTVQANGAISADAAYADFGQFENANYTIETIGETRGGGRQQPAISAIKIVGDAELLCTTDTEINMLDSIAANVIGLKLTHMDGAILTLDGNNFGVTLEPEFSGNTDKLRKIKLHWEGTLINNGTTFVTTAGTTWDNLWTT